MIRDPSDGTVREIVVDEKVGKSNLKPKTSYVDKDLIASTTSGLRQPTRTDAQLRLERSREFVRDYHAKKELEHAEADAAQKTGLRPDPTGENQQADRPRSPD